MSANTAPVDHEASWCMFTSDPSVHADDDWVKSQDFVRGAAQLPCYATRLSPSDPEPHRKI